MTAAWQIYADDNDGNIVNGMAGIDLYREDAWVGQCWAQDWDTGELLPEHLQEQEIRGGALWPYCCQIRLYRCPSALTGEMLNYAIVDSMNGLARSGTFQGKGGKQEGNTVLWIKNLSEIIDPSPAQRMVFIDEGRNSPDSYAVHYQQELWWDAPPVRHSDGATVSFADGHVEHWQWKDADTINCGYLPQTHEGREDLHRLQIAVWGKLGYTPYEQ